MTETDENRHYYTCQLLFYSNVSFTVANPSWLIFKAFPDHTNYPQRKFEWVDRRHQTIATTAHGREVIDDMVGQAAKTVKVFRKDE